MAGFNRFSASRSDPLGLCQVEPSEIPSATVSNRGASVSFGFLTRHSLGGAHDARNNEHHVCARRRVSEAAGSCPLLRRSPL